MSTIQSTVVIKESTDADGNVTTTKEETTKKFERNAEPDYIKIYTNIWCEANQIPLKWRELFLQLAVRMSYANAARAEEQGGQIVATGGVFAQAIMATLGWKRRMYQRGLSELCKCKAIRQVARGQYQINPAYAGRGEWKYNPRLDRGGIENIVGTFNLKEKQVNAEIIWADDGTNSELNETYRKGLGVKDTDNTVLSQTEIRAAASKEDKAS